MLGGDFDPASAELRETETVALKTLPGHIHSHWGSSAWPKDPDTTKLPRRVVKRPVIGFLLPRVTAAGEGRLSTSMPKTPNNDRQPEIAVVLSFRDKVWARRRLVNFVAEIPYKVLNGVIDVQHWHRFFPERSGQLGRQRSSQPLLTNSVTSAASAAPAVVKPMSSSAPRTVF